MRLHPNRLLLITALALLAVGTSAASRSGGGFVFIGPGGLCCLLLPLLVVVLLLRGRRRRRVVTFGVPTIGRHPEPTYDDHSGGPRPDPGQGAWQDPWQDPWSEPSAASGEPSEAAAEAALVRLDDAIRSSAEELARVEQRFGPDATRPFQQVLATARQQAAHAFGLRRALYDDAAAGTLDGPRRRRLLEEILAVTAEADRTLGGTEAEFLRLRGLEADVPAFLDDLRRRIAGVDERLPAAQRTLDALAARYSGDALSTVRRNAEQARELLESAVGFVDSAEGQARRGDRDAAVAAARAAEEATARADELLAAIERTRADLAAASGRIEPARASLAADVADAERLGATDPTTAAASQAARAALDAVGTGVGGDPLAVLRRLTRAEHDLDTALASYRPRDGSASDRLDLLDERIRQVGARVEEVDAVVQSHRGVLGTESRARLAEAERAYHEALTASDHDPATACSLLGRAEDLAELALASAQDDIAARDHRQPGAEDLLGGIQVIHPGALLLGGILGGGLIGGAWGVRGGGWGGSTGGYGDALGNRDRRGGRPRG